MLCASRRAYRPVFLQSSFLHGSELCISSYLGYATPLSWRKGYVEPEKKIPAFSHDLLDILLHIWLWIMHNGLSVAEHLLVSGRGTKGRLQ